MRMNVLNKLDEARYPVPIIHRRKPFDVRDILPEAADRDFKLQEALEARVYVKSTAATTDVWTKRLGFGDVSTRRYR